MPNTTITVGGRIITTPGVLVNPNLGGIVPTAAAGKRPMAYIGYGWGGEPNVPTLVASEAALSRLIRGGPADKYIHPMYHPSNEVDGAEFIYFINASPATQSAATVSNGGATPAVVINLTSADWGVPSNQLQYSVSAPSVSGVKMALYDPVSKVQAVGDNLGVPFNFIYTGLATAVTYTIALDPTTSNLTFSVVSPNVGESVSFDLAQPTYGTVGKIAEALNGTGFYTATVIGDGSLTSTLLDLVTTALPVATLSTAPTDVTATLGAITYWVNTYAPGLATAALATGVTSTTASVPAITAGWVNFSGATSPAPVYPDAFNAALNLDVGVVFADDNSPPTQQAGSAHVTTASSIEKHLYRRFATGSTIAQTTSQAISTARGLDNQLVTYTYVGLKDISPTTGLLTTYSGQYSAAAVAGMMSGMPPEQPMTNKTFNALGVEMNLTDADIYQLENAGVFVIRLDPVTKVPTALKDLTTWQQDSNPEHIYNQQVAIIQEVSRSVINNLAAEIGTVAAPVRMSIILGIVAQTCNSLIYNEASGGVLTGWDKSTLTKSIAYDFATQTTSLSLKVYPVGQNINIVINLATQGFTVA